MSNLAAIRTPCRFEWLHEDRLGEPVALDVVDQQVELTAPLILFGLASFLTSAVTAGLASRILGLGVGCDRALLVMDSSRDNTANCN